MAKSTASDRPDPMDFARRGAQAQLSDLLHELEMLLELFPHLRDSFDEDELPVSFLLKEGSERADRKANARVARALRRASRAARATSSQKPRGK